MQSKTKRGAPILIEHRLTYMSANATGSGARTDYTLAVVDRCSKGIATRARKSNGAIISLGEHGIVRWWTLDAVPASALASLPETFDDLDEAKAAIAPHRR